MDEPKQGLYIHKFHEHQLRNVNEAHAQERQGINDQIAVFLTKNVGSMWTAYGFVVLALVGLLAILGVLSPLVALLVAWTSQTLIQLVLLPVIMVGTNVVGRHAELQADEAFRTTQKTYHDIEQLAQHLLAQDGELLKQREMLQEVLEYYASMLAQMEQMLKIIRMYQGGKWFTADLQACIDKLAKSIDAQKDREK